MIALRRLLSIALVGAVLGVATSASAADDAFPGPKPFEWPKDLVRTLSEFPVQDQGRVKPLSTYARFELLKMSAGTSFTFVDGAEKRRLSAMEWLLDVLFFPEVARHYRCFTVDDDQVLKAVGLEIPGRRKRDRYSYDELAPAQEKLRALAMQYDGVEAKQRTPVQQHTLRLAFGMLDFQALTELFDGVREPLSLGEIPALEGVFAGNSDVWLGDVLEKAPQIAEVARAAYQEEPEGAARKYDQVFGALENRMFASQILRILPGHDHDDDWWSLYTMYRTAFSGHSVADRVPVIDAFGELARAARVEGGAAVLADPAAFQQGAERLHDDLRALAESRGEYGKIPTEVSFYRGKFFWFNPWFFLVGFLFVALGWAFTGAQKWLARVASAIVWVSLVLLIIGITYRCIIRGRPPVSTLYETILFITAVGGVVCMVAEWIIPRRIALGVAAAMGTIGMFLANRYELHEATDTMPQLVAVLDTNFWLATHVTSISVGYAAGLFAAAVGHVYLILRMFRGERSKELLRSIARITYGLLCFGLLFSTVGTILGGIWANDSWGRFWGWDPKENGALLIVLSQLVILHARLGGFLRDFGVAVASVVAGFVVVFSWWGVNLLGVGLHTYGFTSGAALALKAFYGLEVGFLAGVAGWWLWNQARTPDPQVS